MRESDARFAAMLDECCQRVLRGEPLERCLADYPAEYRDELTRLVPLVVPLRTLAHDPSPAFVARLETAIGVAADQARRDRQGSVRARLASFFAASPLLRTIALVAIALVVLVGSGVGVVQASEDSLPDSPLYQVKTAREWIELALAHDDETRLLIHARQIARRGRELDHAVRTGKPAVVVLNLAIRVGRDTERLVDQAIVLKNAGNPKAAERAREALDLMDQRLETLLSQADPRGRLVLRRLRDFLATQECRLVELDQPI